VSGNIGKKNGRGGYAGEKNNLEIKL